MAHSDTSIAVIGGGIGGLSAALSLLQAGFDVDVYEQARTLREVGAGIVISPNATRILHRLGLGDELAKLGVRPLAWHQRRWDDGRTLQRTPLADAVVATFGFPHYQSHRADVQAMLASALPADRLHVGHRLTGLTDHGDRVEALFENGTRIGPMCSSEPTASTQPYAPCCSGPTIRGLPGPWPIAALCRPNA